MRKTVILLALAALTACGGDPSTPSRPELAGEYELTVLTFDPQGVLPAVDILPRLGGASVPRLILAPAGEAQLVFIDPATGLINTSNGVYSTPDVGARFDFGTGSAFRVVLLSRRMTFAYDEAAGTLTFDDTSPDGVQRARLVQLVPEWADEQLLDPVPGVLTIVFTRVQ
jgi:hypothetical protein